jgi:GT2 family glycosyltransferase
MDLSICVLTHSQPELLPACVTACLAEIESAHLHAEVIIVDNASRDRYPAKLTSPHLQVRVIRSEQNLGFSAGNNLAIRQSRGRRVLILNDDAILQRNCLRLMTGKLESDARLGAVGPKLLNPDGSLQRGFTNKRAITLRTILTGVMGMYEFFDKFWLTRRTLTQIKDDSESGSTDELAGACLLLRREALDEVGFFDEDFFYWSEDADLCWRLRKAGWKLFYLADAQVVHKRSASLNQLEKFERSKMFYASLVHFMRKHWHPLRYRVSKLILVLAFSVRVPAGLIYRALCPGKDLAGAIESARNSWRMAYWLIRGSEQQTITRP